MLDWQYGEFRRGKMVILRAATRGFTLIELSIVILIIALLVAGISAAESMIQAAQINRLITEVNSYKTAFSAFYSRYGVVPGDMKNATAYWGAAALTDCTTEPVIGTNTCDGNGNGFIDDQSYETLRAWQHLVNAGLVNGSFNGMSAGSNDYTSNVGVNIPQTSLHSAGYNLVTYYPHDIMPWTPLNYAHHNIFVGRDSGGGSSFYRYFTPQETYMIDAKIDDGMPGTGLVYAASSLAPWDPDIYCYQDISQLQTSPYNVAQNRDFSCLPNFVMPIQVY